ncbi:hypothetical protein GAN23_23365, partial [Bacteroides thetaiotaomicron]
GKILSNFLLLRYLKKIFYNSVAELRLNALLKELKNVFATHCDLVIGTIPHRLYGNGQPAEWVVVMRWDGVGV